MLEVRDLWPRVLVDMGQLRESSLVYRLLTLLELFLYARAERIVVMAVGARTNLIERGIDPEKIVYIPNGADPETSAIRVRARYCARSMASTTSRPSIPAHMDRQMDSNCSSMLQSRWRASL